MAKVEKVAVTVDADVLAAGEKLRKKTGESRSALVTRALRRLLSEEERLVRIAAYTKAYTDIPESEDEVAAAGALARASLEGLPW